MELYINPIVEGDRPDGGHVKEAATEVMKHLSTSEPLKSDSSGRPRIGKDIRSQDDEVIYLIKYGF